jgi:probable rRNA maturation factor
VTVVEAPVSVAGRAPVAAARVADIVRSVLRGERRRAMVSITFVGRDRMRQLNCRFTGRRGVTDVIAFPLVSPGGRLVGDVYVCPWAARRSARRFGVPFRQEVARVLVHGTLHVLGHAHPEGGDRTHCPMWRRQERYVAALG